MINDETRQRFLTAIREKVALEGGAIEEAHVFQSLKQGILETGVAVIAAATVEPPQIGAEGAAEHINPASKAPAENDTTGAQSHDRRVVYTARYRLTLKGPDRGKWEFSIHPEADAPLVTVDKVVRGVQQRSGDSMEPSRLTGEEIKAMLPEVQTASAAT